MNLTDEDVQYLISTGTTHSPNNPFYRSELSKPTRDKSPQEPHDKSIDYKQDSDHIEIDDRIDPDSLPDSN